MQIAQIHGGCGLRHRLPHALAGVKNRMKIVFLQAPCKPEAVRSWLYEPCSRKTGANRVYPSMRVRRRFMEDVLLSAAESARRLGISTASLYDWLGQSDAGTFALRGNPVTISYLQGGAKGQGRIKLEAGEVDRLRDLMRVQPRPHPQRQSPTQRLQFPGITVKLGRPGALSAVLLANDPSSIAAE